jgi:acyl-CoA reductase-like NAD-dependent aldehyde dehydrogenase
MCPETYPVSDVSHSAEETGSSDLRAAYRRIRDLEPMNGWIRGAVRRERVHAPFTGEPLAEVPLAGAGDLDYAGEGARTAQIEWRSVPVPERAAILDRFRKLLLDRSEGILDVVQLETGKARRHAFEEIADVAFVVGYYVGTAGRLLRPRNRKGAIPGFTRTAEVRHPHGVVGVIAPWNYPLVLAVSDSLPAVLAGNAVIVKPDLQTTHTALAALEIMLEAELPAGVFQVVPGDGPGTGSALVDRADYVSFTGSTATGRVVAQRAGARLIGCSLELGGKNPMIVRADADLGKAVAGAVRGCFANAGQLCVASERLYVHRSLLEAFLASFAAKTRGLRLGAGLDYEADMGSLTHEHQLRKVEEHVRDAVGKGAVLHAGGRARPDVGPLFYEPTVLTGVTSDMRLHSAETFGPVVSVYPFDLDDEAVSLANDSCYGLNASIWSADVKEALRMARRIEAGTVNINESYSAGWGSVDAPMGGRKESGTGRRHGAEGLLKFTETQTVAVQKGIPLDLSAPWIGRKPARDSAIAVLKRFRPRSSGP